MLRVIETHNGITTYKFKNGKPISAVFKGEFGKVVAKDESQALEWWDSDKWFRPAPYKAKK
jgi:hypothetical protein